MFFSENNLALFLERVRILPLAEKQLESPWDEPFSEVTGQLLFFSAAAAIHGVTAVKTCPAQRQTSHSGRQILHPHISQGVRPDNLADFFDRMRGSQELVV